ncbi:MAG: hypothetical protein GY696_11185, partial [Gammaproteobacteria bacterium]|nr:hypothetical protein [Gammaproteobacteria bacterium]
LTAKLFLQQLWKKSLQWDDPLPPSLCDDWMQLAKELRSLLDISVPRYFGLQSTSRCELLIFVDASAKAYAAVAFL